MQTEGLLCSNGYALQRNSISIGKEKQSKQKQLPIAARPNAVLNTAAQP